MDQAANLRQMANEATRQKNPANNNGMVEGTRVITVTSGKGGVGKTTLTINMALAMAKSGKRVLLFDADLGLANINILLGVIPKHNLYHVIKGHKTLEETIISTPEGVDIIAGASGYTQLADMSVSDRERLVQSFENLDRYDILMVDTGAGVGANVVGFTEPAHDVVVVTTPEPTAITDAYGIIKSIVLVNPDKKIRLIVNRVTSALEGSKVAERIINICNQFLNVSIENGGYIYADENVGKSVRKQKPFLLQYPKARATACLNIVAAKLLNREPVDMENVSMGGFFRRFFNAG